MFLARWRNRQRERERYCRIDRSWTTVTSCRPRRASLSPQTSRLKYALRYFILSLPMLPLSVPNPCYSRFDLRRSFSSVSAFQTIGEKFPNLRVRGRIRWSENIISPDVYGPLLPRSSFLFTNIRASIHPCLLLRAAFVGASQRNTKILTRARFRFGFHAVLVNFIFVRRYV